MDRSGRRATVVVWAITVMFGAAATTAAAPAAADDSATVSDAPADRDQHRTPGRVPTSVPAHDGLPGARGTGNYAVTPAPTPQPCPWPWPWPWPTPFSPVAPVRPINSGGGLQIESPEPEPGTPVSKLGNGRMPASDDPDAADLALPPAELVLNAAGGAPDAVAAPAPDARILDVPTTPPPAAPAANPPGFTPPAGPLAPGPAGLSPPPDRLSGPLETPSGAVAPALQPPQLGYPVELRTDDLGRIASTALPGLAALVGMTLLGGVIGYRQARAGYLLRAAGAGRFLQ